MSDGVRRSKAVMSSRLQRAMSWSARIVDSQAWLTERFAGLTPSDFAISARFFCGTSFVPPVAFASEWSLFSGDTTTPPISEAQAANLDAIFFFADPSQPADVHLLRQFVFALESMVDMVPIYLVPHTVGSSIRGNSDEVSDRLAFDLLS